MPTKGWMYQIPVENASRTSSEGKCWNLQLFLIWYNLPLHFHFWTLLHNTQISTEHRSSHLISSSTTTLRHEYHLLYSLHSQLISIIGSYLAAPILKGSRSNGGSEDVEDDDEDDDDVSINAYCKYSLFLHLIMLITSQNLLTPPASCLYHMLCSQDFLTPRLVLPWFGLGIFNKLDITLGGLL